MLTSNSLTLAHALRSIREDIQAENTLIASRVTWYVTSQAFFLTAYATSWNSGFVWPLFFHQALPMAAIVLSFLIFISIYAATWAQDVYLREQASLVAKVKADIALAPSEKLALETYERTMVTQRTNASGKVIGSRIHALVRVVPLVLPVGFVVLWLYAYHSAPGLSR